jgi:hypothetical protein
MTQPADAPPPGSNRPSLAGSPMHPSPEQLPGTVDHAQATDLAHDLQSQSPARPSAKPPAALPQVDGYEIEEVLGRGGMGIVYKARHLVLKRTVALKMILAGAHADDGERQRFQSEAEAVARLQHANIVQVHEVGEHNGLPFF